MAEHTTLTSYLEALVAEREELNNVDVDALVEEQISKIRAEIKQGIVKEIEHDKLIVGVKISAITDAIAIVARTEEVVEEDEGEVSEVISDETY